MKISAKVQTMLIQLFILSLITIFSWQLIHRPPSIPRDVFPYLSSLTLTMVKQCTIESRKYPTVAWEDILAIRSTLSEKDASSLIKQLRSHVAFSNLNWGGLSEDMRKTVQRNWDILKHYTYYHPNKYRFPVTGTTWFEDSFGADREGGARKHEGTDLFGKEGTPIVSICSGEVEQIGWNKLGGERVGVRGEDGNYYYYAHLQSISQSLKKGKRIETGDSVGSMGHTGDALTTPDHLHLGIELPNGQWINPYPFLVVWQYWAEVEMEKL